MTTLELVNYLVSSGAWFLAGVVVTKKFEEIHRGHSRRS